MRGSADAALMSGFDITGPRFKNADQYISKDGDNPEAPWPGYGWPLGSECWYFHVEGHGRRAIATGLTIASALERCRYWAVELSERELGNYRLAD